MKPININSKRLKKRLMDFAEIGKDTRGGITRLLYTKEYIESEKRADPQNWRIST